LVAGQKRAFVVGRWSLAEPEGLLLPAAGND